MIVLGAGHAGLLAAAMLRKHCDFIYEAKPHLPNNHSAVLRFRSSVVGDTIGMPMKKVSMIKATENWMNPISDAMSYSHKTNKGFFMRSVLTAQGQSEDRYIAPENFTKILADCVSAKFEFGTTIDSGFLKRPENLRTHSIISTLPMPLLMTLLNYDGQRPGEFKSVVGQTITAKIQDCEAYCSLYIPNPNERPYRISITGDQLIIEIADQEKVNADDIISKAKIKMGIYESLTHSPKVHKQHYMKILPVDDDIRKRFMLWATEKYGVYSLGRFATWRPGLMLDDLVNDVRQIQKMIGSGNTYDSKTRS